MAKKKTDKEFKKEVYSLVGDSYTFLEKYDGAYTPILVKHNECDGSPYKVRPHNFLSGKRCRYCNRGHKFTSKEAKELSSNQVAKSPEAFKKEFDTAHKNDSMQLVSNYINAKTKLKVKCTKCGNYFNKIPGASIKSGCDVCASKIRPYHRKFTGVAKTSSKRTSGEMLVAEVLNSLDIRFEEQKYFKDLKDISYLSYDVYLPDYRTLIEWQGVQHYLPQTWKNRYSYKVALSRYVKQLYHDYLKKEYAKENGYNLICIGYKSYSFEKVKNIIISSL